MSVLIERMWIAWETVSSTVIYPEAHFGKREEIEEYMKEHPMPKDPAYSSEDLILDLTETSCFYSLSDDLKSETRDYIEDLLSACIGVGLSLCDNCGKCECDCECKQEEQRGE